MESELIEQLEKVVKSSPGSPAFARLADVYRSMGQVDKAIALCEDGVKFNPEYPTGHLLLGRCYFEKEQINEALVEFQTVLRLDWKNLFASKILGDIHAQKGEREKAALFYKRAAEIDPSNVAVRDIFRRFEKYYTVNLTVSKKEIEESKLISDSPAETIVQAIDEIVVSEPIDFTTEFTSVENSEVNNEVVDIAEIELPVQPGTEEEPESVHAPINRNIDEFNDLPVLTESSEEVIPSSTEMVDLPPEMTGRREERIGEFKARKSVFERMLDEQSALMDALPAMPVAQNEIFIEEAVPEPIKVVDSLIVANIPDIPVLVEESPIVPQIPEVIEKNGPVVERVELNIDPLEDLMMDIDADDSVRSFIANMLPQEKSVPVVKEEEVEPQLPVAAIEPEPPPFSSVGMDSFYNIAGDSAHDGELDILHDIDTVELEEVVTDTDDHFADSSAIDEVETIELGVDIELPPIPVLITSIKEEKWEDNVLDSVEVSPTVETNNLDNDMTVSQSDIDSYFEQASAAAAVVTEMEVVQPELREEHIELVEEQTIEGVVETVAVVDTVTEETEEVPAKTVKVAKKRQEKIKKPNVKVASNVATKSLADIYLRQGHKEQALTVYKKLLKKDPTNQDLKDRIQALKLDIENSEDS